MSFDNATAQIVEGSLQRCANDSGGGERAHQSSSFGWHTR
jgi:hypothetical protein